MNSLTVTGRTSTIRRQKKKNKNKKIVTVTKVKKKKNRRNRKTKSVSPLAELAQLIRDPCNGPLTRAIGSGSIVERVRSTLSLNASGTDVNGYIVWFPDFFSGGAVSGKPANLFYFENASAAVAPLNTTTNPLGMVAVNTTGLVTPDPGYNVVAASMFSRAQNLAACLQLDYLGALSAISGQVAIIKNFPLKGFASSETSVTIVPPTVNDLFAYASSRERIQIGGHEVIHRPTDISSVMRTTGGESAYSGSSPDTIWTSGTPTSTASVVSCPNPQEIYGVVIAWKGIPAVAGNFQFNAVKAISCELAPYNNQIEPTFNGNTSFEEGPDPITHITGYLDEVTPGWQTKAVNMASKTMGSLAKLYTQNIGVSHVLPGMRGRSNAPRTLLSIDDW